MKPPEELDDLFRRHLEDYEATPARNCFTPVPAKPARFWRYAAAAVVIIAAGLLLLLWPDAAEKQALPVARIRPPVDMPAPAPPLTLPEAEAVAPPVAGIAQPPPVSRPAGTPLIVEPLASLPMPELTSAEAEILLPPVTLPEPEPVAVAEAPRLPKPSRLERLLTAVNLILGAPVAHNETEAREEYAYENSLFSIRHTRTYDK